MLQLIVHGNEYYDEIKEEFIQSIDDEQLMLEHSLVSISKWEAKYHKSFLAHPNKTSDEMLDYIRFMTINDVNQDIFYYLRSDDYRKIKKYIEDPMSATYIYHIESNLGPKDTITSELIYYWMVALQIPFECQYWHLNRLFALIDICNSKNKSSNGKMSRNDIMRNNAAINAARRNKLHSKG